MDEKPINIQFYIISMTLELQSTIGPSTGPSNVVVIADKVTFVSVFQWCLAHFIEILVNLSRKWIVFL